MFRQLLFSMALLFGLNAGAASLEVKVYKGTSRYNADVLCTVRDSQVFRKTSNYNSDVLCTVRDNQIYNGRSSYRSDIL